MLSEEIVNFMVGVIIVIFSVIALAIAIPLCLMIAGIVLLIIAGKQSRENNIEKAKKTKSTGLCLLIAGSVFLVSSILTLLRVYLPS